MPCIESRREKDVNLKFSASFLAHVRLQPTLTGFPITKSHDSFYSPRLSASAVKTLFFPIRIYPC